MNRWRPHKYNLSPKSSRTYRGRVYGSLIEMKRAQFHDVIRTATPGYWWIPQVSFPLGEDDSLRVDFMVVPPEGRVWCEDVKGQGVGAWTKEFRRKAHLWTKYGPCELRVLVLRRDKWCVEVVPGSVRVEIEEASK